MNMNNVLPALGVLFIALKLTGYIDWAWIWVLAPFWVGILLFIVITVLFVFMVPGSRINISKKK